MRRAFRLGAARILSLMLLVTLTVALSSAPSHALTKDKMVIRMGEVSTYEGGPLVGNLPSSGIANPLPGACADPATFCDHVPLEVIVPSDVSDNDELLVQMSISWDDPSGTNDLDTWVYDDQQITGSGYTAVGEAASGDNPETPKFRVGTLREFNLIILNFSGANTGYVIEAVVAVAKFESPFESLDPEFNGAGGAGEENDDDVFVPEDLSGDDAAPGFSGPSFAGPDLAASSPVLPTLDVVVDGDLDNLGGSTFTRDIQEPQSILPVGGGTPPIPKKVPAIVLLFWLLVVPVAMVATGFVVLWRRTRDQFVVPAAA